MRALRPDSRQPKALDVLYQRWWTAQGLSKVLGVNRATAWKIVQRISRQQYVFARTEWNRPNHPKAYRCFPEAVGVVAVAAKREAA